MEKSMKNLVIQIFWIIAIGVIIYLVYNSQGAKQVATPPATSGLEKTCMEIAVERANQPDLEAMAETGNPYLTKKDIPQLRESMIKQQFAECMDIWSN